MAGFFIKLNELCKKGVAMAKFYDELDEKLTAFIKDQKIFFTATACDSGRINLSPKGMDTFCILSERQVAFLSLTGSGNETAAHLKVNGRITLMFCGFEKNPLILRIYGKGQCIYTDDAQWGAYQQHFPNLAGARQIFVIDIESIQTSCGFAVPFYEFKGDRDALVRWAEQKGEEGVRQYWQDNNIQSIDGLSTGM